MWRKPCASCNRGVWTWPAASSGVLVRKMRRRCGDSLMRRGRRRWGVGKGLKRLTWELPGESLVAANPNPSDGVSLKNPDGAMILRNSNGPVKRVVKQAVKLQAGMTRIGHELAISFLRRPAHSPRQLPVEFPE